MRLRRTGAVMMGATVLLSSAEAAPPWQRRQPTAEADTQEPASRVEDLVARLSTASRPGAEHRWLEPLAGSWKMDIVWGSPPQQPLHLTGTCETRWILGGRFLLSEVTGGEENARIEGIDVYGFDVRKRQFFAFFVNSLATGFADSWGSYDPVTRSFIFSGKQRDEGTGALFVYRNLLRIESPDRHVLEVFFDLPGRRPLKVIEATFTRQ